MKTQMDIAHIISKYLANTATEGEKEKLLQWLNEKQENRQEFKRLYDLWLESNALLTGHADAEKALLRMKDHISLTEEKHSLPNPVYHRKINQRSVFGFYFVRIVASVLLLFTAGYIGYMVHSYQEQTTITTNRLLTGPDGKGKYTLPDGSTVWLNANSVLAYPEKFTKGKRMVHLEGEALFEVKKDRKKPFFVHAGEIDIEVLGTCFLVNNYPDKPKTETVLIDGSIQISGDYSDQSTISISGQMITYHKTTGQTELSNVNTDDYTNWIHSKLVFDRTNLANVIINLEKWYGVEIVASPGLATHMHMSFTIRRESLEEVLKNMSQIMPISYKWEDDIVYLSKK